MKPLLRGRSVADWTFCLFLFLKGRTSGGGGVYDPFSTLQKKGGSECWSPNRTEQAHQSLVTLAIDFLRVGLHGNFLRGTGGFLLRRQLFRTERAIFWTERWLGKFCQPGNLKTNRWLDLEINQVSIYSIQLFFIFKLLNGREWINWIILDYYWSVGFLYLNLFVDSSDIIWLPQ